MQPTDRHCLIITTTDTQALAQSISTAIVAAKLGACVQSLPIASVYRWEGAVTRDDEHLLLIKTRLALVDDVERLIADMHSYAVPEIVVIPMIAGSEAYLGWVNAETTPPPSLRDGPPPRDKLGEDP